MFLHNLVARTTAMTLLFAASALAQATISVNPGVLNSGTSASVSYSNPAKANTLVLIAVDNGSRRHPQSATIEIMLDGNGNGTATWMVPSWALAKFNGPDASEVACPIVR